MLHGIDISKHNGDAEALIKDAGFVIIRAGFGKNNIDTEFKKNVALCKKYNKPYGVYWFSYATSESLAYNEALFTYNSFKDLDYKPTLPILIDWETDSEKYLRKCGKRFTWDFYNKVITTYCRCIEDHGCYAGVYCDHYHYKHLNTKNFLVWLAKWDGVANFNNYSDEIWIKQYKVDKIKNVDINVLKDEKLIDCIITKGFNK